MYCGDCGYDAQAKAFCANCGAKIAEPTPTKKPKSVGKGVGQGVTQEHKFRAVFTYFVPIDADAVKDVIDDGGMFDGDGGIDDGNSLIQELMSQEGYERILKWHLDEYGASGPFVSKAVLAKLNKSGVEVFNCPTATFSKSYKGTFNQCWKKFIKELDRYEDPRDESSLMAVDLPFSPDEAEALVEQLFQLADPDTLLGSFISSFESSLKAPKVAHHLEEIGLLEQARLGFISDVLLLLPDLTSFDLDEISQSVEEMMGNYVPVTPWLAKPTFVNVLQHLS